MTDEQIITTMNFIHECGCGRGGYEIETSPSRFLYNPHALWSYFKGEYVKPIGPFRKWVSLSAYIMQGDSEYHLEYKDEFWRSCSEHLFIEIYLRPFLIILRQFVENGEPEWNRRIDNKRYSWSIKKLSDRDMLDLQYALDSL